MKLLLSNDDGVHARGLSVLAETLAAQFDTQVIAPDRDRSGASKSLTLDRPLAPTYLSNGFVSINGTPTDCVHLGLNELCDPLPDMVVAGINAGANLGDDVLYSGTVAAAIEGRFLGIPSLAVSLVGRQQQHYETAATVVHQLLANMTHLQLPPRTILNLNVPDLPVAELRGVRVTRLGHRGRADNPVATECPRGRTRYWIAAAGEVSDGGPDTDFYAVSQGYASITPLHIDMTQFSSLDNLAHWVRHQFD